MEFYNPHNKSSNNGRHCACYIEKFRPQKLTDLPLESCKNCPNLVDDLWVLLLYLPSAIRIFDILYPLLSSLHPQQSARNYCNHKHNSVNTVF